MAAALMGAAVVSAQDGVQDWFTQPSCNGCAACGTPSMLPLFVPLATLALPPLSFPLLLSLSFSPSLAQVSLSAALFPSLSLTVRRARALSLRLSS